MQRGSRLAGLNSALKMMSTLFIRFSQPRHKSHQTVGEGPAVSGFFEVVIKPADLGRNQTSRDLENTRPINAVGAGSPQTVARIVYDVQLQIDRTIIKDKMAEKADVIHLQVDSSTFSEHSMQAVLITLLFISWDKEKDALGTLLYSASKRSWCLNSL